MTAVFKHERSNDFHSMTAYIFGAFFVMGAALIAWAEKAAKSSGYCRRSVCPYQR